MDNSIYFTKNGLEKKKQEYESLLQERPDAVRELAKAREMGDLSENGYYKGARLKLSDIDRRLRQLKYLLKVAKVKQIGQTGIIDIGSIVTILHGIVEKTYEIVGTYESNPSAGKISLYSPLGNALAGKKVGDTAQVTVGKNNTTYIITSVK